MTNHMITSDIKLVYLCSVSYSQNPATGPHPVLCEATSHPPHNFYDLLSYYSPIFAGSSPSRFSLPDFRAWILYECNMRNIMHAYIHSITKRSGSFLQVFHASANKTKLSKTYFHIITSELQRTTFFCNDSEYCHDISSCFSYVKYTSLPLVVTHSCPESRSVFLNNFFLSYFDIFHLVIVGLEGYCYTWSHSVTHTHTRTRTHLVGLLWTRDRHITQTSTWQNTFIRDGQQSQ